MLLSIVLVLATPIPTWGKLCKRTFGHFCGGGGGGDMGPMGGAPMGGDVPMGEAPMHAPAQAAPAPAQGAPASTCV